MLDNEGTHKDNGENDNDNRNKSDNIVLPRSVFMSLAVPRNLNTRSCQIKNFALNILRYVERSMLHAELVEDRFVNGTLFSATFN